MVIKNASKIIMLLLCSISMANAALFKITNRTGGPAALLAMQLLEDDINKSLLGFLRYLTMQFDRQLMCIYSRMIDRIAA